MCMRDYEILSGDTLVAVWQDGNLTVYCEKLLPQYLKKVPNADCWLASRAVDSHRPHSRLLKKALRMQERDDIATVIRANGATVTDNYWVRPLKSSLTYEEVGFDEGYYKKRVSKSIARLSLSGSSRSFNCVAETPTANAAELTNTGSFEKCWKNIEGKWWLYKNANYYEAFSEVFIYHLCNGLGINCAVYEKENKYVRTLNFTNGVYNFEPALTFMGEDEEYENVLCQLQALCPDAIPDYIRMIFLDALVLNPDRHTANFGLLRDKETGEYLKLAPCFDHNMALISRGYQEGPIKNDLLIKLFLDVIREHPEYQAYIPAMTEETLEEALRLTGMRVKTEAVKNYILVRYQIIDGERELLK